MNMRTQGPNWNETSSPFEHFALHAENTTVIEMVKIPHDVPPPSQMSAFSRIEPGCGAVVGVRPAPRLLGAVIAVICSRSVDPDALLFLGHFRKQWTIVTGLDSPIGGEEDLAAEPPSEWNGADFVGSFCKDESVQECQAKGQALCRDWDTPGISEAGHGCSPLNVTPTYVLKWQIDQLSVVCGDAGDEAHTFEGGVDEIVNDTCQLLILPGSKIVANDGGYFTAI